MFTVYEAYYMFRPLLGHHQTFLRFKSTNAAYMLGSQLCLQLVFVEYIQKLIE